MSNTQKRIVSYRDMLQLGLEPGIRALVKENYTSEKRWAKKLAYQHKAYCLDNPWMWFQSLLLTN